MWIAIVGLSVLVLLLVLLLLWNHHQRTRIEIHYSRELAQAEASRDSALSSLAHFQNQESKRSEMLRLEMESLSQRIFDTKATRLTEIGKSTLSDVVLPVRQELEKLKKSIEEVEKNDAVREANLGTALKQVLELNTRLGTQAEGLAKALKGDNKLVGDYGEVLLERLLEYSGLRKGEHFIEQGEGLGLKNEARGHLKPDVLILLPENRCLVVDSKMSLRAWANAQTVDELEKELALKNFRLSVRAHVDSLSSKSYTEALVATGMECIDFKFLFIPIEPAFHACLQLDPDLYQYAFNKRIVLTSPTTLLATLTTVHHTWRQYDIGKNAQEISDRAGRLLDKFHDFLEAMSETGKQLSRAQASFDLANNRLIQGKGNLVAQAEKLKSLGASSRKSLPSSYAHAELES